MKALWCVSLLWPLYQNPATADVCQRLGLAITLGDSSTCADMIADSRVPTLLPVRALYKFLLACGIAPWMRILLRMHQTFDKGQTCLFFHSPHTDKLACLLSNAFIALQ